MSWLRTSKKFRTGLMVVVFLFVSFFIITQAKALTREEFDRLSSLDFSNWSVKDGWLSGSYFWVVQNTVLPLGFHRDSDGWVVVDNVNEVENNYLGFEIIDYKGVNYLAPPQGTVIKNGRLELASGSQFNDKGELLAIKVLGEEIGQVMGTKVTNTATNQIGFVFQDTSKMSANNLQKSIDDNNRKKTTISDIIGGIFAWLLYQIAVGLGWILILLMDVMLKITTYNNFLREGMVQSGWRIVRDICNNFFIILLLITAISAMLRQGEFKDWRNMIPKILVAAVIINFSLLMCGIFIDISQIFTLTFASPLNSIVGSNVILAAMGLPSSMQLSQLVKVKENSAGIESGIEIIDLIAALIYAIITTIVTLVVVVAVTVILAYRIIWLWFLIILSPLPILLSIFKQGSSYANQWWSEFTKYLIVGPVMMFFLYLSFMAMGQMDNTGSGGNSSNILAVETDWSEDMAIGKGESVELKSGNDTVSLSNAASPNGLINFLIITGLMAGSLIMAQKMGAAGSKFAGQSLGWLEKQGKRWSGYNLAKATSKVAPKTVGATSRAVGTAVDDKLGVRQKLYGAAFAVGGKRIPFAGQFLGKRIGELESGTQKRTNIKYGDLSKGYNVNDMNEKELRELASKGRARSVVATQALMKKGLIRDNESDPKKEKENINIIQATRKALKGTDLGNTFDESMKKRNPKLALKTVYQTSDNKLNREKIEEDVKNGKLDFADLLSVTNSGNLQEIKDLMGGNSTGAMKYLNNIFGGNSKKMSAAIGGIEDDQIRNQLFGGIKASDIKEFTKKDEINATTGEVTGQKIADHEKLDGMLSVLVENGIDIGDVKDYYGEDEKARKAQANFVTKNASNLKNIYENDLESGDNAKINNAKDKLKDIFDNVGDLLGKDAVDKLKAGGKSLKDAVDGAFNLSLQGRSSKLEKLNIYKDHNNYNKEKARLESLVEKGVAGGASFDLASTSISNNTQNIINEKIANSSLSDLSNIKYDVRSAKEIGKSLWEKMEPATLSGLFEKKENIKLIKAIRDYVNTKYSKNKPRPTDPDYNKYKLISKYL